MSICKYILGQGSHRDRIKRVFGDTAPLIYPTQPRYSSSNISNLLGKIKKGSQKFRKVLNKNQDFINNSKIEWKKTLECNELEEETLRNAFKMIHKKEFTAPQKDSILRLLTRKTLFNYQHKHIFGPHQARPDWAKEDFCWDCKEEYGEDRKEDLLHDIWTCQAKSNVRNHTLSNLLIVSAILPATTHLLRGEYFAKTG